MAMTVRWYPLGMQHVMKNDATSDLEAVALYFALVKDTYTPNIDTHEFWSSVVANEVAAGNGYNANGYSVGSGTYSYDATSDQVRLNFADPTWAFTSATTWRYGVLYERTSGTDATRKLFGLADWGTNQVISTAYTLVVDAAGFLYVDCT